MSPGSGAKSEYMKRYREPRWDEYAPCYRELLHYRLGRRLLEQAHAPWLWDDWGPAGASDDSASSASSGAGSPAPQCAPESPPPPPADPAAREEPTRRARGPPEEQAAQAASEPASPVKDGKENPEQQQQVGTKETNDLPSGCEPGPRPSASSAGGARRAVRSPQRSSSKIRQKKHPFALYGWGERQTDTGSQKTHNVCASAPVHEIHASALRAQSRRQAEKRRLAARRQRAHSADAGRGRGAGPPSAESPWVTEYMRCYSARA